MTPARAVSWMCVLLAAAAARGQDGRNASEPAPNPTSSPTTSQPVSELPASVMDELSKVRDFQLDYDTPAFYEVVDAVKYATVDPGTYAEPIKLGDWREVVERPSEFRGRPGTSEGIVGRNKSFRFVDPKLRARLGFLWQLELMQPGCPVAATVLLTQDAGDIPLNSTITVTGYFVMVKQHLTARRETINDLLIVARGLSSLSTENAGQPDLKSKIDWRWLLASVLLALVFALLVLRRTSSGGKRTDPHELSAAHRAPMNLADDLDEWAESEDLDEYPPR
jgi:hypothetical protein